MLTTPVGFLIFNRPETTEAVFRAIAAARPPTLLVVADGPRNETERSRCLAARKVIEQIDWPCELLTDFSETNLGCRRRVSTGIDWIFSRVEEAIILEDDCLPAPDFFPFCQELLARFRDDQRVMHIGGANFQAGQSRTSYSYYFSKYVHIWGWASWRRAWRLYDRDLGAWARLKQEGHAGDLFDDPYEQRYFTARFDETASGRIDTWDYQWVLSCWCNHALSIVPDVNLISNIGFGAAATHTAAASAFANLPAGRITQIRHPPFILRNREADRYVFDYHYGGTEARRSDSLGGLVRRAVKKGKRMLEG